MRQNTANRRLLSAGLAAAITALGLAGPASAAPLVPAPPAPVPAPAPAAAPVPAPAAGGPSALAPTAGTPVAPVAPVNPVAPAPAPAQAAPTPATSGTLRDYFASNGVAMEQQTPGGFTGLDIALPVPAGWTQVPDPNVIDAFAVIANRTSNSLYKPNAQLVVYKLVGDFDPMEAISHGYVDSQQLPAWRTTRVSMTDFGGFPSSLIEGTYAENRMVLNTSRRHVIATSGTDRYLVSLAVTTAAVGAVGAAPSTDAIINGFRVSAPGAPAQPPVAPAQPPGPAAVAPVPHAPATSGPPASGLSR